MALWQIALVILTVLALLWTLAVVLVGVPVLLRLRRSAERLDNLLRDAELHAGPALAEVREMARHMNKASAGVADGVAQVGRTFEAIGELGKTLQGANAVVRAALGPSLIFVGGVIAGAKAGGRVLLRRVIQRR